jgi:hypothetical protein
MQFLMLATVWLILMVVAWPFALLALLLLPLVWLIALPFRRAGVVIEAILAFVGALLFLPARLLGHRR